MSKDPEIIPVEIHGTYLLTCISIQILIWSKCGTIADKKHKSLYTM